MTTEYPHATVLRMHLERGMRPYDLEKFGYVQYETVVDGETKELWRKPGTVRCTRGATTTASP